MAAVVTPRCGYVQPSGSRGRIMFGPCQRRAEHPGKHISQTLASFAAYSAAYRATSEGKVKIAAYAATPEGKAKTAKRRAKYAATPKRKARLAELAATPEYRAKQAEYRAIPENKAKQAEYRATPEYKAKRAARRATPEGKAKTTARNAKWYAIPENRAKAIERANAQRDIEPCDHLTCNAFPGGAYALAWEINPHVCWLCGTPVWWGDNLEMDHVTPGNPRAGEPAGLDCADNLRPACETCNGRKSNFNLDLTPKMTPTRDWTLTLTLDVEIEVAA